jgi:hypothetical protein
MRSLADEDVSFGTRVLALAVPNDPVVPADHALMPGKQGRVIPWTGAGLGGHSAIVTSPAAHGIAYSFLSDGAPTCTTRWDEVGPVIGGVWSALEGSMAPAYAALEGVVASAAGPAALLGTFLYGPGSEDLAKQRPPPLGDGLAAEEAGVPGGGSFLWFGHIFADGQSSFKDLGGQRSWHSIVLRIQSGLRAPLPPTMPAWR